MNRKLPPEAYSFYLGLGLARSYDAVAKHYGVTKRSVTKLALKEGWQEKLQTAERAAREKAEEKAQESIEEMNGRHLKTVQLIQRKALEALREGPIAAGMDAVRALVLAVEKERLIRGEPTERTVLDTEAIIRREYQNLMIAPGEKDEWDESRKDDNGEEAHIPAQ